MIMDHDASSAGSLGYSVCSANCETTNPTWQSQTVETPARYLPPRVAEAKTQRLRTDHSRSSLKSTTWETIPLFVRAGSIIPMGPLLQYSSEKPADPIELRVYRGADAKFTIYEDEGDNYNYEKGACATIPFAWNEAKQTLTIGKRSGNFPGTLKERTFHVVFASPNHGAGMAAGEADAVVRYSGKAVSVSCKK